MSRRGFVSEMEKVRLGGDGLCGDPWITETRIVCEHRVGHGFARSFAIADRVADEKPVDAGSRNRRTGQARTAQDFSTIDRHARFTSRSIEG